VQCDRLQCTVILVYFSICNNSRCARTNEIFLNGDSL